MTIIEHKIINVFTDKDASYTLAYNIKVGKWSQCRQAYIYFSSIDIINKFLQI